MGYYIFSKNQGEFQRFSDKSRKEIQVKEIFESAEVLSDLIEKAQDIDENRNKYLKKSIFKSAIDNCGKEILTMKNVFEKGEDYFRKTNFFMRSEDFEDLNKAIFSLKNRFHEKNINVEDIENIEKYGNLASVSKNMKLEDIKTRFIENPSRNN